MNEQLNLDQPPDPSPAENVTASPEAAAARPRIDVPGVADSREVHAIDYIKIIYKRRYLAIGVFGAVVLSVALFAFTATPIYQAKVRLLIEAENPNVVSFKEVVNEQQTRTDYYQTQYNVLQSRSLARKTIEALRLSSDGSQPLAPAAQRTGVVAASWKWIKGLFGSSEEPEVRDNQVPASDETVAQSRMIDGFLSHLTVAPVRNTRLVDLKYELPDPELATRIANAVAENYIQQNLEYRFLATKEATNFLSEQLAEQRKQVQAADEALQKYREQNDAISLEDKENIVVQKLEELNTAVTRAKIVRSEKEALYSQLRANQGNPAVLDTFPAILTNSFIQQLKAQLADLQRQRAQLAEKYQDKHPSMIAVNSGIQTTQVKLDTEIAKVVQSVKSEYDAAVAQEQSLTAALNQQRAEAMSMNKKSIEYNVLDRDARSSKQLYDSLLQRAKETGVSGELKASNIRVVDAAEKPRSPIFPNKTLFMLGAIAGGGLLSIMFVAGFEYFDNRIKAPEEVKGYLGLPHLGMLPLMSAESGAGQGYPLLDGTVPANFSEAFRVLRTNVLFSSAQGGAITILVTSTGPGEGKSMVASNLAVSLAQAGRRVVLVDADMRKPKVDRVFDVPQEPGLSNLLVGNTKASETVRKSRVPGLWILTAGRIPPNPAELLGSQRFVDFVGSLRNHFDWVVIDSPPVMAVADASVIAHLATGVLFVVGSEMTSRHAARRAVEQIETAHGRFFGAVLNRVDLERNAYYYSQYYRREYTSYYTKPPS